MWGAQQSPLPHGRGLFLFSIPGSSHWADQFHDERAEAAGRSSHASKDGQPPGALVLGSFKRGDTDIQCCKAFSMILEATTG